MTEPAPHPSGIAHPDHDTLIFWWRCYRKAAHPTREHAADVADAMRIPGAEPYPCPYGAHWHNGNPRVNASPRKDHPNRVRREWRKRPDRPSVEAVTAAYRATLAPVERVPS